MKMNSPRVTISTLHDSYNVFGETMYIAKVPIIDGEKIAAGFGKTSEQALINLVKWLAGAIISIDPPYEPEVVFE